MTSVPALALMGYGLLVVVLAFASQPLRLRMVDIAEEMLGEGHWNRDQREELNTILDTMACLKTTLLLPVAVIASTAGIVLGIDHPTAPWMARLEEDERFHALIWRYFVSLLMANPLLAAITIPLMLLSAVVALIFDRSSLREAFETPVYQASAAMVVASHGRRLAA